MQPGSQKGMNLFIEDNLKGKCHDTFSGYMFSTQISIIPIIIIIKVIKRHTAATRPVLSLRLLDKEVHTDCVLLFFCLETKES